jgi:8-oxo-dGTP diphosphatase
MLDMEEQKRLSDADYKYVFSKTPRLCVDLAIVNESRLLLSFREIPPFQGMWHFPGGRVLYKETIESAINRLAMKELSLSVLESEQIGFIDMPNDGEYIHSVSLVFLIRIDDLKNLKTDYQASKWQFFSEIPENIQPYHGNFLIDNSDKFGFKVPEKDNI